MSKVTYVLFAVSMAVGGNVWGMDISNYAENHKSKKAFSKEWIASIKALQELQSPYIVPCKEKKLEQWQVWVHALKYVSRHPQLVMKREEMVKASINKKHKRHHSY